MQSIGSVDRAYPQHTSAPLRYPGLLQQGAIVFAGSMVLGVCGFIFQMIASRRFGVDAYGSFYALVSLTSIALLPAGLFTPVVARYAAEFQAQGGDAHVRGLATDLIRWTGFAAILYVVLALALAIPAAGYLHVPVWALPVAGIVGVIGLGNGVFLALAQGVQEFGGFSLSTATQGIAKVAGIAALVGLGLIGGMLSLLIAALCGLAVIGWFLARRYERATAQRVCYDWRRIALSTSGAAAITLATTLIGTVDVILVKHYFSAHEAGFYAAAALGGKVLLFATGFVPTVLLPRVTDHHARGERTRQVLWTSVALLAGVALLGGIGLQLLGLFFLHLLVGHAYDAALPLLVPYALAMIALGLTNLLAYYGVATHRLAFAVPLVAGVMLTLAAIMAIHPSLASVVRVLLVGNVLTCIAVACALVAQARHRAGTAAS